jgi:hypothetical protein
MPNDSPKDRDGRPLYLYCGAQRWKDTDARVGQVTGYVDQGEGNSRVAWRLRNNGAGDRSDQGGPTATEASLDVFEKVHRLYLHPDAPCIATRRDHGQRR